MNANQATNPTTAINMPFSKRISIFLYGIISYAIFFITFLYAIGFVGNLYVNNTIDGDPTLALLPALAINLLLLAIFAIQHSLMARPFFKAFLTQYIAKEAERSTYVLFSSLALILLFYFWQPLGGMIWQFEAGIIANLLWAGFAFGWLLVLYSTFEINHFDLFGLRQVWLCLRNRAYMSVVFKKPLLYRLVRHPLYVGWFFAFWCTPTMTLTHLLFAVATSIYILIAIRLEEKDLLQAHGEDYRQYQQQVPMLIPFTKKSIKAESS